ncbi:alpha/beta fold hydrolase [Virgibacillus siamensis]|uniref:alpha/beta fold hydrolase n=1 Tax=Virgibacillus siamensis TaxID=480071 RepID=UPI0009868E54|nr:alpha/beta fold hydrolase [Virgibacillus siamensis]
MFANVNGVKLFFDVDGAKYRVNKGELLEKPTCFVLHGGPGGTHVNFKPYLDALTEEMQLVYIDNRGSGFSGTAPESTYTIEYNVEDIEELRKYLGLEKILLLGHSYGGMTAMQYAIKYQSNLAGMILVASSPSSRFLEKAKDYVAKHGTKEQQEMAEVLWEGNFESSEQLAKYFEVTAPLYSRSFSENPEPRPKTNNSYKAINQGFGGFMRTYNLIEDLPDIHVPSLVLAGKHDWITPVEENETIAEKLPNSKLVIFKNSSHRIQRDETVEFNRTIVEFVRGLG